MEIQESLNSDIAMILDHLIDIDSPKELQKNAIDTTNTWAEMPEAFIKIVINLCLVLFTEGST